MRLGYNHIDKLDFSKAYPVARQQVFSIQNIQSGFRAAGIQPHDPTQVLNRLNYMVHTPTPPGSRGGGSTSSSTLATPYTVRQLHKKASSVKKILARGRQSSSRRIDQVCTPEVVLAKLVCNAAHEKYSPDS